MAGILTADFFRSGSALVRPVPVQRVYQNFTGFVAGTTVMPAPTVLPTNTNGDQYMSQAITPDKSGNILEIEILAQFATSAAQDVVMALFQDSTANAIAAMVTNMSGAGVSREFVLRHRLVAVGGVLTTFKMRAGSTAAGTTTFNGIGGAAIFGGTIPVSSITITEWSQ